MNAEDRDELVALKTVQGEMEGKILKGVLEAEGIEVLVKGEMVHDVIPLTVDGLGKVTIWVRREDLTKANIVLKEYLEEETN
jgi:hypothetical protein